MPTFVAPFLIAALTAIGVMAGTPARASDMQPGMWRFTQAMSGVSARAARPTRTTRCVRPADAADPVSFFAPRSRGKCEITSNSAFGGRISSQLRCTNGATVQDIASTISIESPTRLTISTTLTTAVEGQRRTVQMTGEGVRTGDCGGGKRRR